MASKLPKDFLTRLSENKRLAESPGVGKYGADLWSWVGFNGFWVLVVSSLLITIWFFGMGMHRITSNFLLGWLYE